MLEAIISELRKSEIDCGLESKVYADLRVWIGDFKNGRKASGSVKSAEEAARWLHKAACKHYPGSDYVFKHGVKEG